MILLDLSYNFNYGSGDNGNAASITNNIDATRSQTFTYDALNRLATAQTGGNALHQPLALLGRELHATTPGPTCSRLAYPTRRTMAARRRVFPSP